MKLRSNRDPILFLHKIIQTFLFSILFSTRLISQILIKKIPKSSDHIIMIDILAQRFTIVLVLFTKLWLMIEVNEPLLASISSKCLAKWILHCYYFSSVKYLWFRVTDIYINIKIDCVGSYLSDSSVYIIDILDLVSISYFWPYPVNIDYLQFIEI